MSLQLSGSYDVMSLQLLRSHDVMSVQLSGSRDVMSLQTSAVTATWDGWTDGDSGMYSYTMEVFAMTQTYPGELQIRKDDLLHPVESRRVRQAVSLSLLVGLSSVSFSSR